MGRKNVLESKEIIIFQPIIKGKNHANKHRSPVGLEIHLNEIFQFNFFLNISFRYMMLRILKTLKRIKKKIDMKFYNY